VPGRSIYLVEEGVMDEIDALFSDYLYVYSI
jgi:hypothetical protein